MKLSRPFPRLALIDLDRFDDEVTALADGPDEAAAIAACVERARCERLVLGLAGAAPYPLASRQPWPVLHRPFLFAAGEPWISSSTASPSS